MREAVSSPCRALLLCACALGCFNNSSPTPPDVSLPDASVIADREPSPDVASPDAAPPPDDAIPPTPDAAPLPDRAPSVCLPAVRSPCYTGPDDTLGVGRCHGGARVCLPDGTWSLCEGQVTPVAEVLCNGRDDDCDGAVDEGDPLRCGLGACARSVPACTDGRPNVCVPGAPGLESCDGVDDDCDGVSDDDDPDALPSCRMGHTVRPGGVCRGGRCTEAACPPGFANCDGNDDNGCEHDVRYDLQNCGGCGVRAGEGEVCFDSVHGTIEQVSAQRGETCVILNPGGRVACWGVYHGAFGRTDGVRTPEVLPGIEGAVTVRTGDNNDGHGCVITERAGERRLYCWGHPTRVMPGRERMCCADLTAPVEFPSLRGLRDVVVGSDWVCALTTGGYLRCLGGNYEWPSPPSADGVRLVPGLTDVREMSSDDSAGDGELSYVCALSGDGLVRCFGRTPWSGASGFGVPFVLPVVLNDLTEVTWIRTAGNSACFGHADRAPECANALALALVPTPFPMYPLSFFTRSMPRSGPREVMVFSTFACSLEPRNGSVERCWGRSSSLPPIPDDAPYGRVDFGVPAALGAVRRGEVEIAGVHGAQCVFRRGRGHLLCRSPSTGAFVPVAGSRPLPP